jgi:undecaprenyl-diphosphatase
MLNRLSIPDALFRSTGLYAAAILGLLLLGYLFGEMSEAARLDEPNNIDRTTHAWLVRHRDDWSALTPLFRVATRFGDSEVAVPASIGVAVVLLALPRRGFHGVGKSEGLIWLGALLGSWLLNRQLKVFFRRERPPLPHRMVEESSYSFPSGHSVFATVFFAALALVLIDLIPRTRPWLRALAVLFCLMAAVLVSASRVWLGVHYPTDVIGGFLLGIGWVLSIWLIRVAWRHWRGSPDPAA